MKLAAARAIADLVDEPAADLVVPSVFDDRVAAGGRGGLRPCRPAAESRIEVNAAGPGSPGPAASQPSRTHSSPRRGWRQGAVMPQSTPPASRPPTPLSGLVIGERPDPQPREGWAKVRPRTAGLNHHDLWSLRGVGLARGATADGARLRRGGVDEEGNEVIVHAVVRRLDGATRPSTGSAPPVRAARRAHSPTGRRPAREPRPEADRSVVRRPRPASRRRG